MLPKLRLLLLIVGIVFFLIGGVLFIERNSTANIEFSSLPDAIESKQPTSTNLQIPSLEINLPIVTKEVKNHTWPLSSSGVIHISGRNIYYGHNWPRLLGNLYKIKVGDSIQVSDQLYQVTKVLIVSPDQGQILSEASSKTLILYTCTGFLDLKRLVVVAKNI